MKSDYEDLLEGAATALTEARDALAREISAYPTPISGCDAQFNRLLSDRRRIVDALRALDAAPFIPTPRQPVPQAALESR
ncbi:MAG: hypothetical protein AAFW46_11530 [Pseudomonadota bacterium]